MMKHLNIQKTMRWICSAGLLLAAVACNKEDDSFKESEEFTPEKFEINIEKDHYGQRENRAAKAAWTDGDVVHIWASKESGFTATYENGEWTVSVPSDMRLNKEGGILKAAYSSAPKSSSTDGIQCEQGDVSYTTEGKYTVSDNNLVTITLNLNQHPVGYITFNGVGKDNSLNISNMKFVESITYTEAGFDFAFNDKGSIALKGEEDGTATCYVLPTDAAISGSDLTIKVKYGDKLYTRTFTGKSLTAGKGVSIDSPGAAADKWTEVEEGIIYNADDLKIGDYFYSDGTTSDGGLRELNPNSGAQVWETPKPAPNGGKTLIGIVFTTERISEQEKAKGWNHGLVVSIDYAPDPKGAQDGTVNWYNNIRDESEIGIPNLAGADYNEQYELCNNDINGYYYNQQIRTERQKEYDQKWTYYAFWAAGSFAIAAPEKTSGWYVPSAGQMLDIYRAAFGNSLNNQQSYFGKNGTIDFQWGLGSSGINLFDTMKTFMADRSLMSGATYLTSSAYNEERIITAFYNKDTKLISFSSNQTKKAYNRVRFVLSF